MRWPERPGQRARFLWPSLVACVVAGLLAAREAPGEQASGTAPPIVGTLLPSVPDVPPGTIAPDPPSPLNLARIRAGQDDWAGVVGALGPWLDSRRAGGRERIAGLLLFGLAELELGNWNLASGAFYRVRAADGPLASYGAWYEAVVDHKRGRHTAAAAECKQYRTRWPDGPEAENCLLLIAEAYAMAGQRGASLSAYQDYLDAHPDTPRKEEIRLGIALATATVAPQQAIPMLQDLVLSHSWHSTALSAQAALDDLGRKGYKVDLPTDVKAKMRSCESERRCGRFDEAWGLFQQIAAAAPDNPEAARWVEQNEDRITWSTRQYDLSAKNLEQRYAEKPSGDLAWQIFIAWTREGDWQKAVDWIHKARKEQAGHYRWKRPADEVVWAETLAGDYAEARDDWTTISKTRGGQDARFYAAFCAMRAGDLDGAEAGLSPIAERDGDWQVPATYWRYRTRLARGDAEGAEADRQRVLARDRHGWYRLLLNSAAPPSSPDRWTARNGRWGGPLEGSLPEWQRPELHAQPATGLLAMVSSDELPGRRPTELSIDERATDWSTLRWPLAVRDSAAPPPPGEQARPLPTLPVDVPDGYQACLFYDPVAARKALATFSEAHKTLWPDLPAANDLVLAGVYDEASRLLEAAWKEWDDARDHPELTDPRSSELRALTVNNDDWRQFFLYTHDHYQAARFCAGLDNKTSDPDEALAARRLAWPIVRGADLWRYGREFDVDPLLLMGLMRQESTYQSFVVSPANAIGLIQVLPSTGARVAALLGEGRYSPGDLEIPEVNLRYGSYYFSLLMRRFDGVFPLAVASYNGGPHNVSRWYQGWHDKIELDAFVEQIPFPETRDYVKRVTGYYAQYVNLYAPRGAAVVLPPRPLGDDASVVNW